MGRDAVRGLDRNKSAQRPMTFVLVHPAVSKKKECRVGRHSETTGRLLFPSAAVIRRKQRPQYGATRDGTEARKGLSSAKLGASHCGRYIFTKLPLQRLR